MCTRFRLTRTDLFSREEPLEMDLVLTEVLAVPGHWSAEKFVPAPLVKWAALPHEPGDFTTATVYSPGNPGYATYRYQLTALSG